MLKIISAIVFVVFGAVGAHAVYQLGYWQAVPIIGVAISYLIWEIFTSEAREAKNYQELLADIEEFSDQPIPPARNLQDAQNVIAVLQNNLNAVTEALVTLKSESIKP